MIFENYFLIIYLSSFFTSIISASIGFVGGTALLVIMAQFLKMAELIPLHGIIQLASNSTRTFVLRKNINWKIGKESLIGAIIGATCGYFYLEPISEKFFNVLIGLFVIFITLKPKISFLKFFEKLPKNYFYLDELKWILLGFFACSLGLFVGAIGTFVGAILLTQNFDKKTMVATQAFLQSIIHLAKIIIFSFIGFSLSSWTLLIAGSIICVYFGTLIGAKILNYIPEKYFRKIVTCVILILATRLLIY